MCSGTGVHSLHAPSPPPPHTHARLLPREWRPLSPRCTGSFSPFTGPGMKLITGAADGVIKQWPFAALAMGGGGGSTGGDGSATGGVDSAVKEQEYVGHGE